MSKPAETAAPGPTGWFATTHWSLVLAARDGDGTAARESMEQLCSIYWPAIYRYLRRDGHRPAEAEDLTQGFFAHLLEQDFLTHLQHRNGKFRSFLLTFLKHYLSDQRDKVRAQKRGGGKVIVSLEQMAEEERLSAEPAETLTPERIFERRWVQSLLAQAVERLRREYVEDGRAQHFEHFKDLQPGEHGATSYAELGALLGLTEQAVKNAVLRFRQRYGKLLEEEIAQTLADPSELKDEIRHMLAILGGRD